MAGAIEHRNIQDLLQSYDNYGCVNFTIWQGKDLKVTYDEGEAAEAKDLLENFLNTIQQSGTTAVYTLKVYKKNDQIKTGTMPHGSTTFQFTSYVPAGQQQATKQDIYIAGTGGGKQDSSYLTELRQRLDKLEQENVKLRDDKHAQDLAQLRSDFQNQIAGLSQPEEKTWQDHVLEHKDTIRDIVKEIASIFRPPVKDYTVTNIPAAVSGTAQGAAPAVKTETTITDHSRQQPPEMETTDIIKGPDGQLINPFLTDQERELPADQQGAITTEKIEALTEDQQNDVQSECMEIIVDRVGNVMLTRLILAVACMDKETLNTTLSYLA